jgi:putative endonuclease
MPFVYIMASGRNGTLYVGVTRDLIRRVHEHKTGAIDSFTKRYGVHDLVWYQHTDSILSAIQREKQMKAWRRDWKIELIEQSNPYWHDLYPTLLS